MKAISSGTARSMGTAAVAALATAMLLTLLAPWGPSPSADAAPDATPDATADATPDATPDVTQEPTPEETPEATPEVTPEPTPDVTAGLDTAEPPPPVGDSRRPVTLAFVGDVHGEGVLRTRLVAGEDPLDPVAHVLTEADVAVVNLETAVGTSGAPQPGKIHSFQAPPQLAASLARSGVDVVSLANNHALDFGPEALAETVRLARQAGLATVGAGDDAVEAYAPALLDVGGRRIAVVGLSRVLPAVSWAAGPATPGLASAYDEDAAAAAVARAATLADHVVVTIHWGVELATCPDGNQRRLAARLAAAGADIIAGHHPHVLQGTERIGDALVAYSLGNFSWYHDRPPSRDTAILTATLSDDGVDPQFRPARIGADGSPRLLAGADAATIDAALRARSTGGAQCAWAAAGGG